MKSELEPGQLRGSLFLLQQHIISEGYRGYDPFDGLMSPIFRMPVLRSHKLIRLVFQQVFKRSPLNLRRLFRIQKGLNPVTVGLCIQAFTYLSQVFIEREELFTGEIDRCLEKLTELRSSGFSGACWGYDFDWEARYARIPAYTPTVVATGIIENALYEYYVHSHDERAKDLILSAAEFVVHDLNRTWEGDTFCFSYSPADRQRVYNASMKGARILSHAYLISKEQSHLELAEQAVRFVINHQNPDGSWSYSYGDDRTWADNFHTAYVLESLKACYDAMNESSILRAFNLGLNYYVKNFFTVDGIPKYYSNAVYPIDSTSVAQSIFTLTHFGHMPLASQVTAWTIANMQSHLGYFYYQRNKSFANKSDYMRWSNAPMFVALSYLAFSLDQLQPGILQYCGD